MSASVASEADRKVFLVAIRSEHSFASAATFDAQTLESILRDTAESRRVKAATLIHAVRVAVTGKSVSPGIFDLLALLGREPVHIRLEAAARESSRVAS